MSMTSKVLLQRALLMVNAALAVAWAIDANAWWALFNGVAVGMLLVAEPGK